ncbi:MAG TPA: hypothetical protein VLB09_05840, partial [Nitrospiria bacterium]|nr:hypothetical protein [Nitrospiria bacterium]
MTPSSKSSETYRVRKSFSKIPTSVEVPDLIDIQKSSYERFLQMSVSPNRRTDKGLQAAFNSV